MKRPSRGASLSATTMRYIGTLLRPSRRNRIRTAMTDSPTCGSARGERSSAGGKLHPRLARDLHELLHLLELRQQLVDFLHGASRSARHAGSTRAIQHVRCGAFPLCHRQHDGLDVLEALLVEIRSEEHTS